jgi:phage gp36-like protein
MPAYLTAAAFKERTLLPVSYVEQVIAQAPTFLDLALEERSSYIDALCGKRYAVPFVEPVPNMVKRWLTALVSLDVYMKRGFNPTDDDADLFVKQFDTTITELKEAADAKDGLYQLPLKQDAAHAGQSGITKGFSRVYSEGSPFVWKRLQRERGTDEDRKGHGTKR